VSFEHHVLLWLLALPLVGAIVVAWLGPKQGPAIRWISLATSLAVVTLALILAGRFMTMEERGIHHAPNESKAGPPTFTPEFVPGSSPKNRHVTTWKLMDFGKGSIQFYLGLDGLNIWMVVLTAILMLPSVLISWTAITDRVNEFYGWLLALQTCMIGIFLSFDIILFYTFFEISLVPLFFLIGIWGSSQRQLAARKFFLYTLTGSLLTLLGVIGVVLVVFDRTGTLTFSIPDLVRLVHEQLGDPAKRGAWFYVQLWVFFLLTAGFAVKVPLVPFHTWLPLAHVEAPTAGSVDLAGVLLKVGVYGFLRLCIPLAPDVSLSLGLPLVSTLAAIGIVYAAFCAYSQPDMKRLIAYSSVSHLGLCMLGMFSLNVAGISGSIFVMINHGITSAALFLLVGMIYERYHTRQIADYGGMATKLPLFGFFLVFMVMSSVGLPGLNGFPGELLCLVGIVQHSAAINWILTVTAASGLILGAWYLITMTRKVLFGKVHEPAHDGHAIHDLQPREWLLLTPLMILCLYLGMFPMPVLNSIAPDVNVVADIADRARDRRDKQSMAVVPEPERLAESR
jgi:NADH-quinone oxidoreductase subunit M